MGISRGTKISVPNPDNNQAGITLDWLNDTPRLRIGGTGVGVANGFEIQQAQDQLLWSVNSNGLAQPQGGLSTPLDVIGRSNMARGYQSINSGSSYSNQWTLLAQAYLTSQYADANAIIDLMGHGGSGDASMGRIYFRVKQQNAMGSAPGVYLKARDLHNINESNIVAVTTINSASVTEVQLWVQNPQGYQQLGFAPTLIQGMNFFDGRGYQAALPSGVQTSCWNLDNSSNAPLTLNNNWVNYGSGYQNAMISKLGDLVKVEGMIKSGTSASGTTIATIPAGWQPPSRIIFMCPNANGTVCRVDVLSTGAINVSDSSCNNAWLNLSAITYTLN